MTQMCRSYISISETDKIDACNSRCTSAINTTSPPAYYFGGYNYYIFKILPGMAACYLIKIFEEKLKLCDRMISNQILRG
jgi:hypothetical protein